ncbi:5-methylcytosine restriction system specificity protein McrC [Flavobacterium sp. UBA7680]|uniref:5-methylcytosine restriction system specificity protein McrC n=1 Tax=Flavobacterium sp. UBA7680 TaxID=1946559 RepID=UPI0025BA160B|nr:restriction endonuclease [Flavobacterium sp. UBA7680]
MSYSIIEIHEQFGYNNPKCLEIDISEYYPILNKKTFKKEFTQKWGRKSPCYQINYNEFKENYIFEASYFVGVDWIVENKLPIYIKPKLNDNESQVNYIRMLFDAVEKLDNFNYLDHLYEIRFDKPAIEIDQAKDLLSPLLVIQYLQILKKIVQKGLKKSYYPVISDLNAKVKGKILINTTIKKNHVKNKILNNYCKYEEFGINSVENKILKKALQFCQIAMKNINGVEVQKLQELFNYIQPAFYNVKDEVEIDQLKTIKPNPLYKEYEQALKLAKLILKRYGFTISTINSTTIKTPPFWIDMSKLFELYVFAKLKEIFPLRGEVKYHFATNYQELDFIINSKDKNYQMVVDAKYKPRYNNDNVSKEDIRQVSGYARMKSVYEELEKDHEKNEVIDCLIIYSNQDSGRKDFVNDNFKFESEKNYVKFFKIGIELPIV